MAVDNPNPGPSAAGFHFLQDYKNCRRYFYHKYIDDIEAKWTPNALLFGISGHAGLEAFYNGTKAGLPLGQRIKDAVEAFREKIHSLESSYEYSTSFQADLDRGETAIREYGLFYPQDTWEVLSVEEELEFELPSGNRTTCRIDLVIKDYTGAAWLVDHKFTGWSLNLFKNTLRVSDQTTHYKMIWDSHHSSMKVQGVIYNVIRAYKDSPPEYDRLPLIKTEQDVAEHMEGVDEEFSELRDRIMDPNKPWQKNTSQCFKYNRMCEFSDICLGARNIDALVGLTLKKRDHQLDGET